jgi:hypothetical protein
MASQPPPCRVKMASSRCLRFSLPAISHDELSKGLGGMPVLASAVQAGADIQQCQRIVDGPVGF